MVQNRPLGNFFAHAILIFGVALVVFPIYIAIIASTHPPGTFVRGVMPLLPGPNAWENYQ
jgi:sn-glycerol 3-phosphate transport system permease protein